MQFFNTILITSALAAVANAIAFTNTDLNNLSAGQPITLTWSGASSSDPIIIVLKNGPSSNLQTVTTITSTASGSSYTWTPPTDLPSGSYALQISQGSDINYSNPFTLAGSGSALPSGASSASASAASGSSTGLSSLPGLTTATYASASASSSAGSNTTFSSATLTSTSATAKFTGSRPSSSSGSSSTSAPNSNSAAGLASPLAFVLSAVAAMIYLN